MQLFHMQVILLQVVQVAVTGTGYDRNSVFVQGLKSMADPNECHLGIYNRWSELLFESRNILIVTPVI